LLFLFAKRRKEKKTVSEGEKIICCFRGEGRRGRSAR